MGLQEVGMGQENFPCHTGWGEDGVKQNYEKRRQRPYSSDSPCPIAIPN